MRRLLAIGVHGAVVVVALAHHRHHQSSRSPSALESAWCSARAFALDPEGVEYRPTPSALAGPAAPHARADWMFATRLLALEQPLDGRELMLDGRERACLRVLGVDIERLFRGLLYQFHLPGQRRREITTWQLAQAITDTRVAASMTSWLRREASRSDLDDFNRWRAVETLAYLRRQASNLPHSWERTPEEQQRLYQLIRDVREELAGLNLPPRVASWAAEITFH
jgi:hypothetical protein